MSRDFGDILKGRLRKDAGKTGNEIDAWPVGRKPGFPCEAAASCCFCNSRVPSVVKAASAHQPIPEYAIRYCIIYYILLYTKIY